MVETSLVAVFLLGLFGGVHCAGMCGGIVAALGLASAKKPACETQAIRFQSPALATGSLVSDVISSKFVQPHSTSTITQSLQRVLAFNLARISTYTALGALAGAIGSLGFLLDNLLPVQQAALIIANLILVVMGLYVMGISQITRSVESLGRPVWRRVQPYAAKALTKQESSGLWLAGALWGLVPCGMVYTVLIASMTTAHAMDGALLMAAFGLGTLPSLTLMGLSAQWLARIRKNPITKISVGAFFIIIGAAGLLHIEAVLNLPVIGELCFRPQ